MKRVSTAPKGLIASWDRPDNWNRMHRQRRPRLHCLALLLLLSSLACGQEVKTGSQSKPAGRQRLALEEQWFLRGRSSLAGVGALQRYRAYLQKMRMRADRLLRAQAAGAMSPPSSAVVRSSLGPAPLASDASGTGQVQLRLGFGTRNRDCD